MLQRIKEERGRKSVLFIRLGFRHAIAIPEREKYAAMLGLSRPSAPLSFARHALSPCFFYM